MPIYYLHLCKQMIIYSLRKKDHYISCGSPSSALPFHLFKKTKKKRETLEILNAAVIETGYSAKEKMFPLWSFGATVSPYSTPP